MSKGWHKESIRHSLASRGIKTIHGSRTYTPIKHQEMTKINIDPMAYPVIKKLNKLGINTEASCEGHFDKNNTAEAYIRYKHKPSDKRVERAMEHAGWYIAKPISPGVMLDEKGNRYIDSDWKNKWSFDETLKTPEEKKNLWKRTEIELDKLLEQYNR